MKDPNFPTPAIIENAQAQPSQQTLFDVTQLAQTHMAKLKESRRSLKRQKEFLDDLLDEQGEYREAAKIADIASTSKKVVKNRFLLNDPQARQLTSKIDETKYEIKELQGGLSAYLDLYYQRSGKTTIVDNEGKEKKIKRSFKV